MMAAVQYSSAQTHAGERARTDVRILKLSAGSSTPGALVPYLPGYPCMLHSQDSLFLILENFAHLGIVTCRGRVEARERREHAK